MFTQTAFVRWPQVPHPRLNLKLCCMIARFSIRFRLDSCSDVGGMEQQEGWGSERVEGNGTL